MSQCRATRGTCTGHKDRTKLPYEMLLLPGSFGYTTMTFGGTLLLLQENTGGHLPGLFLKVSEGPVIAGPCVEMSRAMSIQQCLQGLMK